ncbi:MAG: hypothetical protein ACREE4_15815 [Stellaceae bacterium]
MSAEIPRCGDCKFYEGRDIDPVAAERARAGGHVIVEGLCRRCPQVLPKQRHEWCGEFKGREAE